MDIPTIPGAVYTISSTSSCDVTDKASGQLLGTASSGSPFTTPAYSDALTLSDPSALYVQIKTFNFALAALGLLGGGSSTGSALPSGYIAADWLGTSTGQAYITVPLGMKAGQSIRLETEHWSDVSKSAFEGYSSGSGRALCLGQWGGAFLVVYPVFDAFGKFTVKTWVKHVADCTPTKKIIYSLDSKREFSINANYSVPTYTLFNSQTDSRVWTGRKRTWKAWLDGKLEFDLVPAIAPDGQTCMYNKVTKEAYSNIGAEPFVVGMTLSQALKLADLPSSGGTLTASLPTGYDSDSGVMSALETARANGWTLTIQTYTLEASASATTFALRRIWVRRTADENGLYVAADGTRWQVDWCVDMLTPDGSTPDAYGYELFRSQEAAVAYWELSPYVDPEAEQMMQNELLTE